MARSPAVTIMMIFMMLIPLCWAPGRADRVTPLFRFVCARRPLLPSHVPAQSPGEWLPTICRFGDGLVQMRLGGSGRTQINQMVMVGSDGEGPVHGHHSLPFGSSLRLSNYRRRVDSAPHPSELRRSGSPHGSAVGGNRTH